MGQGTPAEFAKVWRKRLQRLTKARKRGLTKAASAVDRAQIENLRGGTKPGDYPVPVISGNLLGSHFFRVKSPRLAIVGNDAAYAIPIHEGKGSSRVHGKRQFLIDAVKDTDVGGIVAAEVSKAMAVPL